MRISSAFPWVLALAACSSQPEAAPPQAGESAPAASDSGQIDCALGGVEVYDSKCTVERAMVDGKPIIVIRHPDGGFRRFTVLPDGKGLAVADGAEKSETARDGAFVEIDVGGDAYRLPFPDKPDVARD